VQWLAGDQWSAARGRAGDVALFGDLPFMVSGDSADVWARQDEFRMDASVGVPPDAFSETGQDWGLPVYRWDVLAERDLDWLRDRAHRNADLFDGYRVDHLVGFYRTYFRPHDGSPAQFIPDEQDAQQALGERVLSVFREPGSEIIAEDLGVVPDFVRASLGRLSIAGYKVFRWERHWHTEGHPFRDPVEYPAVSVATSGTHDTEPLEIWWEDIPREEREAVSRWRSGGKTFPARSARRCWRFRRCARCSPTTISRRSMRRGCPTPCMKRCSRRCSRRAPTRSSCRSATSSAGAIASTSPRR